MDMFLNSKFAPVEIDKERNVIKEELAMYLDQPHQHVQELLNETLWPDHPLGRPLTGTEQTLDSLKRPEIVGYQRSNYLSKTTLVVAAGNVQHERVVKAVAKYARHIPQGRSPSFLPAPQEQEKPRLRLFTKATEQTQLALGVRTCSRHDDRRFALRLLSTLLGENMSSRLFQVVREDHGLAYSIYSSLGFFDDAGVLTISAGMETENVEKAFRLVMREVRRVKENVPSPAELRRARDYLIGQLDLSLENTESRMMWAGEQLVGYGKIFSPEEIKQRLFEVRAAEIRAVARDFLQPQQMSLALVSPLKRVPEWMRLLRN
jgi:predicted Zn-dependent peptidase